MNHAALFMALCVSLSVMGCGPSSEDTASQPPANLDRSTPEQTTQQFQQAAIRGLWEQAFQQLTTDSRALLLGTQTVQAAAIADEVGDPARQAFDEILVRYGVKNPLVAPLEESPSIQAQMIEMCRRVEDKPRCMQALVAFCSDYEIRPTETVATHMKRLKFGDFETSGDRCVVPVDFDGSDQPLRWILVRLDDHWRIDLTQSDTDASTE